MQKELAYIHLAGKGVVLVAFGRSRKKRPHSMEKVETAPAWVMQYTREREAHKLGAKVGRIFNQQVTGRYSVDPAQWLGYVLDGARSERVKRKILRGMAQEMGVSVSGINNRLYSGRGEPLYYYQIAEMLKLYSNQQTQGD